MRVIHSLCLLLFAPALANASAFPWALPAPTAATEPDNWSPVPTFAPRFADGSALFKRQTAHGGNTCGFVSGLSQSSLTCPPSSICATNTLNGVHGCCPPSSLSACTIPTTCIPSSSIVTLCTDTLLCISNEAVLKCTASSAPECVRWIISYSKTSMTQHSCGSTAFTSTAQRSYGGPASSISPAEVTVTIASTPSATPTLTPVSLPAKPNLAAIIGGTIAACTAISFAILSVVLLRRHRKARAEGSAIPQYRHGAVAVGDGFQDSPYVGGNDAKSWNHAGPVGSESNAMPNYPGMSREQYGIVEVDGVQSPVEAPSEAAKRDVTR
ncbi:hypothetical protein BDU57DRAFT_374967 [Ampelomyces quisqualis]|uniref:Mid2 domain-containing protein n=1 Tax=Ampelomyces quisqualis TaxID=50730 RepID=A0A6A5QBF7_AMPQU|nr:hypothetical protein BDU57DRAFT_374967 [Ampelomyces quisqualis]